MSRGGHGRTHGRQGHELLNEAVTAAEEPPLSLGAELSSIELSCQSKTK